MASQMDKDKKKFSALFLVKTRLLSKNIYLEVSMLNVYRELTELLFVIQEGETSARMTQIQTT